MTDKSTKSNREQYYYIFVPLSVADDVEIELERFGVVFHRFAHPDDDDTIEFDIQMDTFMADLVATMVQRVIGKYEVIDILKPFMTKKGARK